jgi:WD40 repeat protein
MRILAVSGVGLNVDNELKRVPDNAPTDVLLDHDDAIQSMSLMPESNKVFLSASLDGTVRLWDVRSADACQGVMTFSEEQTCVQFNPQKDTEFVECGTRHIR